MVKVGNTILIVVLSLGLLAAATYVALTHSPSQPDAPSTDLLIAQLAADDDAVAKSAEEALLELDEKAIPSLEAAAKSDDKILAARAKRLLKKILDASAGVQ